MGTYLNPGNYKFQEVLASDIYVDKTGLLKYTNSVQHTLRKYVCVSRPRRFGKSVTVNMLAAYYSQGCDSEKMFTGLEISEDKNFKTHLNQYISPEYAGISQQNRRCKNPSASNAEDAYARIEKRISRRRLF